MEDKKIVTPVQPYLTLDAEDYQELLNRRMGISSFYEFNVKNGNSGNFRAVPDGSTDLVFGIGAEGADPDAVSFQQSGKSFKGFCTCSGRIYAAEDLRYRWKYFHSDAKP